MSTILPFKLFETSCATATLCKIRNNCDAAIQILQYYNQLFKKI